MTKKNTANQKIWTVIIIGLVVLFLATAFIIYNRSGRVSREANVKIQEIKELIDQMEVDQELAPDDLNSDNIQGLNQLSKKKSA